jgi:transketolase
MTDLSWVSETQKMADRIRVRGFDYVMRNNGGYLSQICSSAELFALMYGRVMTLGKSDAPMIPKPFTGVPSNSNTEFFNGGAYNGPVGPEYDRFLFSPAHYALVLYVALIEAGRMAAEGLEAFNTDGSTVELIGAEHSPGIETTTGSLAQALSQAGGIALARRIRKEQGRVWIMMSDGEFQEGQTWEAVQALVHYKLDNVGVYVDVNQQQCDGAMEDVMQIGDLAGKLNAFGARAFNVDGHDLEALSAPAELEPDGRPLFVLANTDPARGVPRLLNNAPVLHYLRFKSEVEKQAYQQDYQKMAEGVAL